ncbi:ABC transporter ATP-binding protein [Salinibacterium sp. ZJ70]|uniref:ABC transporter ATP-binding protein n=1 Tax=Salinibacterium sp. ZJ70 TaxID=2708084 RepID=UPI0014209E43|nr:ABC transporter ATP-binding protein [Salinibacterium sp. ZJ70]
MLSRWWNDAVRPRLSLLALMRRGPAWLVSLLVVLNLVSGLLPVAFVLATSTLIALVPAVVAEGPGGAAWGSLVVWFVIAAAIFTVQQLLGPVVGALSHLLKRRLDGLVRDDLVRVASSTTGIAVLEDQEFLDHLDAATRFLEADWATPGSGSSGLVALLARYTQLVGLVAIVSAVVGWWAGLGILFVTLIFRYGQRGGMRKYSTVWDDVARDSREYEYFLDLGTGPASAKELRVFDLASWIADRTRAPYLAMFGRVAAERRRIFFRPYIGFTIAGLVVVLGVLIAMAVLASDGAIDIAGVALGTQAVALAVMLGQYYPEADVLTQFGAQILAAIQRVEKRRDELTSDDVGTAEAAGDADALPLGEPLTIRFENVSFRYPGSSRPVLDGLDLELAAGRSTALVGVNGAGKTTLVKLLTRLYEPTSGRITANGVDIRDLDPNVWRRSVSVIFQDFVRYELSARDNIALGAVWADAGEDAVHQAAERAAISDVLDELPGGLDTVLSRGYDGGVDLSGGQWQRVAIARSLYALGQGAGVLVLDEPTSALDVRAEVEFFDRYVEITRGATSLLISHRFSSVRRADRIVVIADGRVVEDGDHASLLDADGHYARLFRLQADRFARGLGAEEAEE